MKNPDKITLLLANPRVADLLGIEVDEIKVVIFHSFEFKRNGKKYKITLHEGKRENVPYKEIEFSTISNRLSMFPSTIIRNDIETWEDITKLLKMFNELTT